MYNACRSSIRMPCRYAIDKARRLVITTLSGRVTFDEAKAHQTELAQDPDFSREYSQLLDGTTITSLELSPAQIRVLAQRRMFSSASRRAVVATNPAFFGVGRMLQTYLDLAKAQEQVSVFYDRESALRWLGLDGDLPPDRTA
jgi:hypothetical protein